MKTKKTLPITAFIIFISLLSFIIANIIVNPISFGVVPEDISYRYNITVNNTAVGQTANITVVNITLPSEFVFHGDNFTSGKAIFTNTSNILTWYNFTGGLINGSYNVSFMFNATVATAGTYNFTVTVVNSSGNFWTNHTVKINDTTFPTVAVASSSFVTGGNYSDSFSLIATIIDDTESLVYFNVTNSSGGQNGTFTASNPSGNSWNATINTSKYIDGLYNISIWVNDSNNQINNSIVITNVRFDNTNPTNTYFYCSPSSAYTGETVTCYCEGSADGGSGVASTSFTVNPSTATTGTHTETCTITDRAGNSIAPTTTYTISSKPNGDPISSGSGSTTKTWGNTYTLTDEQFTQGYTKNLAANERVKIKVKNEDHHIGIKSVSTTSAIIEISSDPIEITLDIGEDAKVDINNDEIYDIYILLNDIVSGKADITIKKIAEEIPEGEESITTTGEIANKNIPSEEKKNYAIIWIIIVILILIALGAGYKFKPKKR